MSRIGKKPIPVPHGVKIQLAGNAVSVEGPKGKLRQEFRPEVGVRLADDDRMVLVECESQDRNSRAIHGLTRALVRNMIVGVAQGYEKRLQIVGVGYLAAVQDKVLSLRVGFAHEVEKEIPAGLTVSCPDQTRIVVQGCDKQLVGQFAAEIRAVRKPEPYKGKGIRYENEYVKIKPGKAAT
jgi:large subunit ribosomal protein L6